MWLWLAVRSFARAAAVGMAAWVQQQGWGLFNQVSLSIWLTVSVSVVLLDLAIYWQHRVFHQVPILWRLHRVHHADPDFDLTTALRFHPIEILLSMLIKLAVIVLLGPPLVAVLLFEVILNGMAMFNHANARLPKSVDQILRPVLVTPDMHRVHHSIHHPEFNRNFGFNLAIWDRIFGTYKEQPDDGHTEMTIGLPEYQANRKQSALWMILLPFRRLADPSRKY